MIDRFRSGSGGLRLTLAWLTGLRGAASVGSVGVERHGVVSAGAGEACACKRHDCGGVVPVGWCAEHGDAVGPVMEWHPGGGIRCTELTRWRTDAVTAGAATSSGPVGR
ncbi:hypothetical protein [Streptomyces sp. NPDC058279]|uniref:hypothetical protein n=1 Tax=Streptomyces sp. NPDC058279 TaxID=3346418 RepID=UPI0036E10F24